MSEEHRRRMAGNRLSSWLRKFASLLLFVSMILPLCASFPDSTASQHPEDIASQDSSTYPPSSSTPSTPGSPTMSLDATSSSPLLYPSSVLLQHPPSMAILQTISVPETASSELTPSELSSSSTIAIGSPAPMTIKATTANPTNVTTPMPLTSNTTPSTAPNNISFSPATSADAPVVIYSPFTSAFTENDLGAGVLGEVEAAAEITAARTDFWEQAAAAIYHLCRHACDPSGIADIKNNLYHYCQQCRCDDACLIYGDCCPDVYARLDSSQRRRYLPAAETNKKKEEGEEEEKTFLLTECYKTSFGSPTSIYSELPYHYVIMVTRCPELDSADVDARVTARCETNVTSHWNLTRPVTDRDSFVTYKNRYCARCHSAASANLTPWNSSIVVWNPAHVIGVTSSEKLYAAVLSGPVVNNNGNEIVYEVPRFLRSHVRACGKHTSYSVAVSRCNVTGAWLRHDVSVEMACLLVTARVVYEKVWYRNPFCLLCNTRTSWTKMLKTRLAPMFRLTKAPLPLLFLLDFDGDENHDEESQKVKEAGVEPRRKCSDHQFFDFKTESCRDISYSPGKLMKTHEANNITCRSSPAVSNVYGYKLCVLDIANNNNNDTSKDSASLDVVTRNVIRTYGMMSYGPRLSVGFIHVYSFSVQDLGDSETVRKTSLPNLYVLRLFLSKPADRDETDRRLLTNLTDFLHVVRDDLQTPGGLQLAPTCSERVLQDLALTGNVSVHVTKRDLQFRPFYESPARHSAIYLPLSETLTCPFVELASGEFQYDPNTNEMVLRYGDDVGMDEDDSDNSTSGDSDGDNRIGMPYFFVRDSGSVIVCLSEYRKRSGQEVFVYTDQVRKEASEMKNPPSASRNDNPLYWTALLSTVVSLAFLLASFFIYCLLPPLRTVAGMNNLTLCVALFAAQLFLQIGAEKGETLKDEWLCEVLGVATHFSWLAVMLAQTACTFHMFFTLSFPLRSHADMTCPARMTRKYTIYVLGTSTVFVAVTLIWQVGARGESGYGGPACYLTEPVVRIVAFAAPLAVSVVMNAVMFAFTIVRLSRSSAAGNLSEGISNSSSSRCNASHFNRNSLVLYTKLSVFTGLTWLLGFLASLLDSEVLSYLFAVLQGCQGLFVFLAFLANRRVMELLREKLSRIRGRAKGTDRGGKGHSGRQVSLSSSFRLRNIITSTVNTATAVSSPFGTRRSGFKTNRGVQESGVTH